jgi:Deoxyribonuclease NucA/NucB
MSARWRLLAVAAVVALTGCASATTPVADFGGCAAYTDAQDAQRAWERSGRPAGADGDGDGRVCEALGRERGAELSACRRVRRVVVVRIAARRYPHTADHILDAIAAGKPRLLRLDRAGADANREEALQGIPTRDGYDRDEYPPAVSREGGRGADVRYVPSADNRGAGAILGERLERYCDGQRFRLRVTGRRLR